uniref:(northern house mosquito) hypothetical protein n=1 Tax=Culex pipiens TaxID=7175 RepID=A0A8D8E1L0_CULPI
MSYFRTLSKIGQHLPRRGILYGGKKMYENPNFLTVCYFHPSIPKSEILIGNVMLYNFVDHSKAVKLNLGRLLAISFIFECLSVLIHFFSNIWMKTFTGSIMRPFVGKRFFNKFSEG